MSVMAHQQHHNNGNGTTSPSKIPISKHRLNSTEDLLNQAPAQPVFVSRIPKAISPVRTLSEESKINNLNLVQPQPQQKSSSYHSNCKEPVDGSATFVRRISPPSASVPTRNDSVEEKKEVCHRQWSQPEQVDIDTQLVSKVQEARRNSESAAMKSGSSNSAKRKKNSTPVTSPSRIPIAADYFSKPRSSSRSTGDGSQPTSHRNSPARNVSPPRKPPAVRERTFSKSSENLNLINHDEVFDENPNNHDDHIQQIETTPISKIPLPRNRQRSPPKALPTVGWSFSPERMLPNNNNNHNANKTKSASQLPRFHSEDDKRQIEEEEDAFDNDNEPRKKPKKFEAFMMTGDRIISLAKTPANSDFKSNYPKPTATTSNPDVLQERFANAMHEEKEKEEEETELLQEVRYEAALMEVSGEEVNDENEISGIKRLEEDDFGNEIGQNQKDKIETVSEEKENGKEQEKGMSIEKKDVPANAGDQVAEEDKSKNKIVIAIKNGKLITARESELELELEEEERENEDVVVEEKESSPQKTLMASHVSVSTISSEEDVSDIDSLHSYHPPVKIVDFPSAVRLAKRLYQLDGFKKTDVSRHLSKNTDYNHVVAEEFLKYFTFDHMTLDIALRDFLTRFCLTGETQERERVLFHFSKRFVECNPDVIGQQFRSQDSVHTLTCAIMLLNTDLHGEGGQRKMSCAEFIENLSELNDGFDFPKDLLKSIYFAIKETAIPWAGNFSQANGVGTPNKNNSNDNSNSASKAVPNQQAAAAKLNQNVNIGEVAGGVNPFLEFPDPNHVTDFKNGYVMRKSCYDANGKKTKLGKRSWRMFFLTLRDMVLYCFKDEKAMRVPGAFHDANSAIRIHHALAVRATDYSKKQFVFRLHTADQAQYLFQTSDEKELLTWIDAINSVVASFSSPILPAPVSSQTRFQRPLLPSSKTTLAPDDQLQSHENQLGQFREEIEMQLQNPLPRDSKQAAIKAYRERIEYLRFEIMRFETYVLTLKTKSNSHN